LAGRRLRQGRLADAPNEPDDKFAKQFEILLDDIEINEEKKSDQGA